MRDNQHDTIPTDHGELRPSKAEYREAAEAATEMGLDAQNQQRRTSVGAWVFVAVVAVWAIVALTLLALRGGR
jgi:hypothetical protein